MRAKGTPARELLALIANKWSTIVLYVLAQGTMRYLAIGREVGGISQKMLTQTLQDLERSGLVSRQVYAVVPPRVEYSLTDLGQSLVPILGALCAWCEGNAGSALEASAAYDRAQRR